MAAIPITPADIILASDSALTVELIVLVIVPAVSPIAPYAEESLNDLYVSAVFAVTSYAPSVVSTE